MLSPLYSSGWVSACARVVAGKKQASSNPKVIQANRVIVVLIRAPFADVREARYGIVTASLVSFRFLFRWARVGSSAHGTPVGENHQCVAMGRSHARTATFD